MNSLFLALYVLRSASRAPLDFSCISYFVTIITISMPHHRRDFASASCALTLSDHTQAVWGVAAHYSGDFVASCSMDHTARLFDLNSGRCRQVHERSIERNQWNSNGSMNSGGDEGS
jgi:WD40 repeat protein